MTSFSKMITLSQKNAHVGNILQVLAASLFIALSAQISFPIPGTPVPVTGQTFGVLLVGSLLGRHKGVMAVLAYLGEILLGLPVLADGMIYPLALVGCTAGYLIGFIPMAYLAGWFMEKQTRFHAVKTFAFLLICPSLIQLLLGSVWLGNFVGWELAFTLGFHPFIAGAIIKCLAVTLYLHSQKTS